MVTERLSILETTIASWRTRYLRGAGVLAEQRERIQGVLLRLGVASAKTVDSAER